MTTNICVLMASHNRCNDTLNCLEHLYRQTTSGQFSIHTILVDDGSTDGTSENIRVKFPQVQIIQGGGSLYWTGGMRLAFENALHHEFDHYLLLNDDTILHEDAVQLLLDAYQQACDQGCSKSIIVGSTRSPDDNVVTYGGQRRRCRWLPMKLSRITPGKSLIACDTFNANCVLIPKRVANVVGNISASYTHGMGDYDYGFRATKLGCKLWVAHGYVGECKLNYGRGSWNDKSLTVKTRWQRLLGPKGLPPKEWYMFTSQHSGPLWVLFWASPYIKFWLRAIVELFYPNRRSNTK